MELRITSDRRLEPIGYFITKDSEFDAMPEVELLTADVAGKNGSYIFGTRFKDRVFTLDLVSKPIFCSDNLEEEWRRVTRILSPLNGFMKLYKDDNEGVYADILVTKNYQFKRRPNSVELSTSFLVRDGFFKSIDFKELTSADNGRIYCDSDVDVPFILEEKASDRNIYKSHTLELNGNVLDISSTGRIVYDSYKGVVTDNGLNAVDRLQGGFIKLRRGYNDVKIHDNWVLRYRDWYTF